MLLYKIIWKGEALYMKIRPKNFAFYINDNLEILNLIKENRLRSSSCLSSVKRKWDPGCRRSYETIFKGIPGNEKQRTRSRCF